MTNDSRISHLESNGKKISLTVDAKLAARLLEAMGTKPHVTIPADDHGDSSIANRDFSVSDNSGAVSQTQLLALGLTASQIELLPSLPTDVYDGKDRGLHVFERHSLRDIVSEKRDPITVTNQTPGKFPKKRG